MKLNYILLSIIIFLSGALTAFIITNYPFITWNHEVKISEVAQILATLSLGIFIPLFANKWMDTNKNLKTLLISECKDTLASVQKIRDKILFCYEKQTISKSDKDEIILLFSNADLKISFLEENIESIFHNSTDIISREIKNEYNSYWKAITDGSLMADDFILDNTFYRLQLNAWSLFEHKVYKAILVIQQL